jgi:2-polyprenyl-3-methyl-5-hydroxy-6-metoxy-1,4-benzoquinol methylase
MTAAEQYAASVDAVNAQRTRLHGQQLPDDRWGGETAQRYRYDPHRSLDANLEVIASYVQREDVLIDVGGGAGRVSLPLALRCRELVNVDASTGMLAAFEALAAGAGIQNARAVKSDWLAAEGIQGDVTLVSSVTYFVRDIVPFVQKLEAASRRRVLGLVGDGHSARCPRAPDAAHTGGLASTHQVSPDVRRGDGIYPCGTVAGPRRP